ncbi:PTS sugar transporter subunit IIA [Nocardia otitidiscaviarum]|uniref:PTS sugar transporter subunit IIA n=1 Tax=Nocardia otitidiscaviarum TaxID=1823 RepID=UPI001895122F|nr:PTS glucose transporter subunit IIA [Nocardia otitidiscaviarum]MBF6180900.1 PTS glucose transporter subunit IIA [Nocardia otitidiscaviarum]
MSTQILSPLAGIAMPLSEVPDPVFSAEMVGAGVAVEPLDTDEPTTVVAPVSGTLVKLHPHAAVIVSDSGAGVLLHVGIDTVGKADLFQVHVEEGAAVNQGDALITFSPNAIRRLDLSAAVPVVVMDTAPGSALEPASGPIAAGAVLFSI